MLKPVEKFSYLRAELESKALKSIAGLEPTNVNYEVAINMLKEIFHNKQLNADLYYTQVSSLWRTYDTIKQYLRFLNASGEDTNQRQMISTIQSKLTKVVPAQLEGRKDGGKNCTVGMLRKSLKNYITTQETAENLIMVDSLKQGTTKSYQPNQ